MADMSKIYAKLIGSDRENGPVGGYGTPGSDAKSSTASPTQDSLVYDALGSNQDASAYVFCAEPGMGRTTAITRCLTMRTKAGDATRYEGFANCQMEEAMARLSELLLWCKSHVREGRTVSIAIDDLPAGDEYDSERMVRALRAMHSLGARLYISLLPEAECMVEQFGEAKCFWSCNLRIVTNGGTSQGEAVDVCTHGIPALVEAAGCVTVGSVRSMMDDPGYAEAYANVVRASIRHGLMAEERRLRIILLLLGHGTFAEAENIVGNVDNELWRALARDAPLFGVSMPGETFYCAGGESTEGLISISALLCDAVANEAEMVVKVAHTLAQRCDYRRSAMVSMISPLKEDRCETALRWAAEYINVGELDVVREVVRMSESGISCDGTGLTEAKQMIAALEAPTRQVGYSQDEREGARCSPCAQLSLACRRMLSDLEWVFPAIATPFDPAAHDLMQHAQVARLMLQGRLADAYVLVTNADVFQPCKNVTVTSALLCMDYALCSTLMGVPSGKECMRMLRDSSELFLGMGLSALEDLRASILPLGALLAGRKPVATTFEADAQRASRMGDVLVHGVFLAASAIVDVRAGLYLRAHVRLMQAEDQFERGNAPYLQSAARILDACTRAQLGERVTRDELNSCKGAGRDLDRVVAILQAAFSKRRGSRKVGCGRWDGDGSSRKVHWILNIVMGDFNKLSTRVREVMPVQWKEAVQKGANDIDAMMEKWSNEGMRAEARLVQPSVLQQPLLAHLEERDAACTRVHIRALGGFEVRVDGVVVSNRLLERRRAKSMLALLVAVPGHSAKRFTLMESVWPEYDYETATRCVYSATSVLRSEICGILGNVGKAAVIVANKADRTLALDPQIVSCDVDVFEELSRRALDNEGDDEWTMESCRQIEELYSGGLFVPQADEAGIVATRARELRGLYCDAMIAGAKAAMRANAKMLACRFAKRAYEADGMREDAICALAAALDGAGRQVEAEQVYEHYVGRMVDITRRPPSKDLRRAIREYLGSDTKEKPDPRPRHTSERSLAQPQIIEVKKTRSYEQLRLDIDDNGDCGTMAAAG